MLNGQIHEDRISTLSENVSDVQTELCNQIKDVQKKFKSFDGLLKQLSKETSKSEFDKQPYEIYTTTPSCIVQSTGSYVVSEPVQAPGIRKADSNNARSKTLLIGKSILKGIKL